MSPTCASGVVTSIVGRGGRGREVDDLGHDHRLPDDRVRGERAVLVPARAVEVEVEDGNATAVAFHIAILVADVIEPLENEIPFSRRISQFECRKSIIYW